MFCVIILTLVLSGKGIFANNETLQSIIVTLNAAAEDCHVAPNHTFEEGSTIILTTQNYMMRTGKPYEIVQKKLTINKDKTFDEMPEKIKLTPEHNGEWKIDYLYLRNATKIVGWKSSRCGLDSCLLSTCKTNVIVVSPIKRKLYMCIPMNSINISAIVFLILCFVLAIVGQAYIIVNYKRKVQKLTVHNNLTKENAHSASRDIGNMLEERYSAKPRRKIEPADEESKESGIYALPDVDVIVAQRPPMPLPHEEHGQRPLFPLPRQDSLTDYEEPNYGQTSSEDPQDIRNRINMLLGERLPGFVPKMQPDHDKPTTMHKPHVQVLKAKATLSPTKKPVPPKPVRMFPPPIISPKPGVSCKPRLPTPTSAISSPGLLDHEQVFKEYREKHSSDYWEDDWYDYDHIYDNDLIVKSKGLLSECNKK